ncbi:uncharacterized protein MYCGRDRAFT_97182 [Zymoseptoria tritici IPO323]|uniref:Uncharacterized protein n=1 Tax=Zymoseptoria tritici (strain CBS 115943 / IPO323) TaxID=336722 RepID=F9XP55_ZYMTI|nr:uncharacterized protein MYCGRDRAFT_97182 [Zymoseptoria tritici IPO323]EGP83053.1 hypothetical protein MYCGRDRAFT_97182 [Zymoseptoria tritici IPO323]
MAPSVRMDQAADHLLQHVHPSLRERHDMLSTEICRPLYPRSLGEERSPIVRQTSNVALPRPQEMLHREYDSSSVRSALFILRTVRIDTICTAAKAVWLRNTTADRAHSIIATVHRTQQTCQLCSGSQTLEKAHTNETNELIAVQTVMVFEERKREFPIVIGPVLLECKKLSIPFSSSTSNEPCRDGRHTGGSYSLNSGDHPSEAFGLFAKTGKPLFRGLTSAHVQLPE